ncbi:metal-binding protein [Candidatus Bipolaricaulota bacterium]|nr:metal-binding protein [Candidatus Bipolaricaulota bacterium]
MNAGKVATVAVISMPSGKTHLTIEAMILFLWAGLSILVVSKHSVASSQATLFLGSYVFSMFLMSPDLDLSKSDSFQRWGPLRWIWFPYAWLCRHRQTSHHLLLGPLSRVAYLVLLVLAGAFVYLVVSRNPAPRLAFSLKVLLPAGLGLYLPNLEHILIDRMSTAWRRKRRKHRL